MKSASNPIEDTSVHRLIIIGLLASAFFSSTFILNYMMRLNGGHWYWSGALRPIFITVIVASIICMTSGYGALIQCLNLFRKNIIFWTLTGTIGFGVFYTGLVYAADYARAWIIAATWQTTVLATPIVCILFGYKFPIRGIIFATIIVGGVFLINYSEFKNGLSIDELKFAVLPVIIGAFAYALGNQLLNAAKYGTLNAVPHVQHDLIKKPLVGILLLSLGSFPYWVFLYPIASPPSPSSSQVLNTFLVAFLSGICATGLFFYARNLTSSPYKAAAVDATMAGEVLFTLAFEVIFLDEFVPGLLPSFGIFFIMCGLIGYAIGFNNKFNQARWHEE